MQQRNSSPDAMRGYLEDPAIQRPLQQQLELIRRDLATTIGKATELVGVQEAKLRYWETIGLLTPSRSNQESQAADRSRQRYYRMDQLAQALIIKELEKTYSLADIKEFIKNEAPFIASLITAAPPASEEVQEEQQSIARGISSAEEALLWEFFLPRALYLSLCLLFQQAFVGHGGIYVPVRESGAPQESFSVTRAADLPKLGEGLLGWHEPNHAFFSDVFKAPPPELLGKYEVISLKEFLPSSSDAQPVGAHMILDTSFAALLRQADRSKKGVAEPLGAAGRLLRFLQDQYPRWRGALHARKSALLYDSPKLTNPSLGEPLLNEMADVIVGLGGRDKESQQSLWRFCCILLPDDLLSPLMSRSLVVKGQSKASPYKVGDTKLAPTNSIHPGLSILAYQSGSCIYRPRVTELDPSLASREREEPIGSAIAIPIEGEYGKALGVLYVVSTEHDAFSVESQHLLRLLGRVIGELATSSRSRDLTTDKLPDLLEDPEVVDQIFKGYRSVNTFRSDLQTFFQAAGESKKPPFQDLSFVAIDIDDLGRIALKHGDQAAVKNLVDEVGQRIRAQALHIFARASDIRLYRAYVDRFYLLLKDMPPDQAAIAAEQLRDVLKEPYRVYALRVSPDQPRRPENLVDFQVTARLGVTGSSYETLKDLRAPEEREIAIDRLERKLYDALEQGKGKGGAVVRVI